MALILDNIVNFFCEFEKFDQNYVNFFFSVYFETGSSTTASTLAFTIATTGGGSWRIKVSQIECKNPGRAPFDCLQYFTGRGGNIKSINFDGGVQLQNIAYTICIRQELGYCGIEYRAQDGTSPDTFDLSDASAVAANVRFFKNFENDSLYLENCKNLNPFQFTREVPQLLVNL